MGADLISYIVFVPEKLDVGLKDSAVAQAQQVLNEQVEFAKKEGDPDIWDIDPQKVVEDLFEIWNGEAYCRDAAERRVPGQEGRKVMICGEMSWGDEPEGWGFQTMKAAEDLGVFPILELE